MSDYDVIVVGAGNAGSAAAITMASKGLSVLLVDRSDPPGTKNFKDVIITIENATVAQPGTCACLVSTRSRVQIPSVAFRFGLEPKQYFHEILRTFCNKSDQQKIGGWEMRDLLLNRIY